MINKNNKRGRSSIFDESDDKIIIENYHKISNRQIAEILNKKAINEGFENPNYHRGMIVSRASYLGVTKKNETRMTTQTEALEDLKRRQKIFHEKQELIGFGG
jgi:hypothetical protein